MKIKNVIIGAICLGSLPFITGGAGWDVPACDASAVVDTAKTLASTKDNFSGLGRHMQFKNIKEVRVRPMKVRTCVAEIHNNRKFVGDFYYQVVVTNGTKWGVSNVD